MIGICLCVFLQLTDTKSNDKKISLLHFIVMTIEQKFPEVRNFEADLQHVEKASAGVCSK